MITGLFNWLLSLVQTFAEFGSWLTTELDYVHMTPLALISVTGISLIIGFLLVRLVIGG